MPKPSRRWRNLAAQGFSSYEISNFAEVRERGCDRIRATNAVGALNLRDDDGVKRCRVAGKLCRIAFGAKAPGATIPREKLTSEQVVVIITSSEAPTVLAARFGVSPSTIKAARARRTHADVKAKPRAAYEQDRHVLRPAA